MLEFGGCVLKVIGRHVTITFVLALLFPLLFRCSKAPFDALFQLVQGYLM